MKEIYFRAPWTAPLMVMTTACIVFCCLLLPVPGLMIAFGSHLALRALAVSTIPPAVQWAGWVAAIVPILVVLVCSFYAVRGYVLTDTALFIKRPGWNLRLDLDKFVSATADPEALRGSLRICGNGGCFAFVGWYRNKTLGVYRAFATDSKRTVVIRLGNKTVVITPDDPQKFVAEINSLRKG